MTWFSLIGLWYLMPRLQSLRFGHDQFRPLLVASWLSMSRKLLVRVWYHVLRLSAVDLGSSEPRAAIVFAIFCLYRVFPFYIWNDMFGPVPARFRLHSFRPLDVIASLHANGKLVFDVWFDVPGVFVVASGPLQH